MIYLNGKYISPEQVQIQHNDRGFLLADGIFETLRAYNDVVFRLRDHWDRLQQSSALLELIVPITFEEFQKIIDETLRLNNLSEADASLRLTITRGTGP